jgi:hypothetical protein
MVPHHDQAGPDEPPASRTRTDAGGPWSVALPLIALALIGLMLMRTCAPSAQASAGAPVSAQPSR